MVSRTALYVRRPGGSKLLRFTGETGLRDWPLMSVEGGAPGQAFVGYEGVFGPDPLTDPEWMKRSGDLDRVQLRADGTLSVHRFDLHNSNTPVSGKYDETRTLLRILYVHDGPRTGEVYVGSTHGATRIAGNAYADHRHPETYVPNGDGTSSYKYGEMRGLAVTPEGDLLVANKYKLGRLGATDVLDDWWRSEENPWLWALRGFPGPEIEPIHASGIGVAPDGTAYFGSYGEGVAALEPESNLDFTLLDAPDPFVTDVVADPDGTVWIGSESGLHRYDPASGAFTHYGPADGVPAGEVLHLDIDSAVSPRALVVVAGGDVGIFRGE